jgi:hypothetical protein
MCKKFYYMRKYLGIILFVNLFYSCQTESKVESVERSFYVWGSSNFDQSVKDNLNKQKIKKLYIKYFEVAYSETMGNFPQDKLSIYSYEFQDIDSLQIVPTIFIKNEIFSFNDEKKLDALADNIVYLITKFNNEKLEKNTIVDEIQIDCDWTKTTRKKYFYLLKKIKQISKKEISCTLRLYPYKYSDLMGVPPVDKVTLMCYNLIKPLTNKDQNSILDINELKLYLDKKRDYPLHIDIALPVFNWTQLYQNNQFAGLKQIDKSQIQTFAKLVKPMWYEVNKDTTIDWSDYYRIGDQIKYEEVSNETLQQAINIIKKNIQLDKKTTITLFSLDNGTFKKYKDEEISSYYNSFTE